MKFTEARLEQAIIDLPGKEDYTHILGEITNGEGSPLHLSSFLMKKLDK